MDSSRGERGWALGIVVFAILTRALYLSWYLAHDPLSSYLIHDAARYQAWAVALAGGGAFESGPFYQAPLYPYLLSLVYRLCGSAPPAAYALQALGGVALVWLVLRIGRRSYGPRAGLWAAGLTAAYGVLPFYESKLLPASLAALLAAATVDQLQRAERRGSAGAWLVAGLLAGLGALVQPGSLLLLPGVAVWLLAHRAQPWRQRGAALGLFVAAAAATLLPVTLHNRIVGGETVLVSTNGGITFFQGNNENARGIFSVPPGFSGSIFEQRAESRALAEAGAGRRLDDAEVSRYWLGQGLAFIRARPLRWLALLGWKAGLALDDYDQALEYNPQLDPNPWRRLLPLSFAWLVGLALVRLVAGPRWRRIEFPLLLSLSVQAVVLLLFYVSGRYRLPAAPALLVLAGCGAARLVELLRGERRRLALALACGAAAVAFSLFFSPLFAPELQRVTEAGGLCDRAEAYAARGATEQAIESYRRAARRDPGYPFAPLDLAKLLARQGRGAEALEAARQAVRLAPALAEARFDLGVLLYQEGRLDEAAEEFAEAWRLAPRDAAAANNLLGTLLRLERTAAAGDAWREMRRRGLPVDPPLERRLRGN